MLSPVLCILPQETMSQIETGRQRDPKESWLEESHRSFYTYRGVDTEKSLHKANPCKLQHSLPFLNRFFALMNAKNAAMLSPVLCILPQERMLQIEIGRQRDPKESWREESQRSFYTYRGVYAEKSLHKAYRSCYTKTCLHRGLFTHRRVCTQKCLDREVFTQRSFYTQKHLHTASFYTPRGFYTEKSSHKGAFYTQKVLHREVFTPLPALLRKNLITSFRFVRILVQKLNAQLWFDYSASCLFKKEPDHFLSLCSNTFTRIERATPVWSC